MNAISNSDSWPSNRESLPFDIARAVAQWTIWARWNNWPSNQEQGKTQHQSSRAAYALKNKCTHNHMLARLVARKRRVSLRRGCRPHRRRRRRSLECTTLTLGFSLGHVGATEPSPDLLIKCHHVRLECTLCMTNCWFLFGTWCRTASHFERRVGVGEYGRSLCVLAMCASGFFFVTCTCHRASRSRSDGVVQKESASRGRDGTSSRTIVSYI